MHALSGDMIRFSIGDEMRMKGARIQKSKRIPFQILLGLSIVILFCHFGFRRESWIDIDTLIYSNEKQVSSSAILAELTPFSQKDLLPAAVFENTQNPETMEYLAEDTTALPKIDHSPTHFYVSKIGDNSDGLSWETAWNELDQIDWERVGPGDTILLDGGKFEMVYSTQLMVVKSGVYGMPITIKMAHERGRDGKVVIFGGRSTPLPYCGQNNYIYQTYRVGKIGLLIDGASWIVIDGTGWSGIAIHGHNTHGIQLSPGSDNVTLRNIEVYDNGTARRWGSGWRSDSAGIFFSGSNLTFERLIVHDNGQDAFQSDGGNENFILRQSWLYNARRHPTVNESFNYCSHSDGLQIYNGEQQSGFLFEESIIGPGFTNGLILGSISQSRSTYAVINDVTLRDVLLTKAADNNILSYPKTQPQGWILDHVTVDCSNTKYECLHLEGSDHRVSNSIFWGAKILFTDQQIELNNNCQWESKGSRVGEVANPLFEDVNGSEPFYLGNYTLTPESPCEGSGSRLTSVRQLFGQKEPEQPLEGLTWISSDANISFPFILRLGTIYQQIETDHSAFGGRACFRFNITSPGYYVVEILVDAPNTDSNSLFMNMDDEPISPTMIWDIRVTNGFEERIVSWRGNGTEDENQDSPKVFDLDVGTHELILVGREKYVRIKEVSLNQVRRIQDINRINPGIGCCRIHKEPTT